jgi:hypothetical protein
MAQKIVSDEEISYFKNYLKCINFLCLDDIIELDKIVNEVRRYGPQKLIYKILHFITPDGYEEAIALKCCAILSKFLESEKPYFIWPSLTFQVFFLFF